MIKLLISYWTNGDRLVKRIVESESVDAAIEMLKDDPQEPLAQLKDVRLAEEVEDEKPDIC